MPEKSDPYVGFGFGAIQSGLFLYEAFQADPTRKLIVAEVVPEVVSAINQANGVFHVNIAHNDHIEVASVKNLKLQNPNLEKDCRCLIEAVAFASEIGTALPSVEFYGLDDEKDICRIIANGLIRKIDINGPPVIIYTAENNNHAAEILEEKVLLFIPEQMREHVRIKAQFVNTVIGKMSQVIADKHQITARGMATITPRLDRAFLVESFNRILISKIHQPETFIRGIPSFEEKDDLLRFEEAKLFGHNATHAMIGYLCALKGVELFSNIPEDTGIISFANDAFFNESGKALINKYRGSDVLFTDKGYHDYVDDLIRRMTNPYLNDAVERVTRDTVRKLAWNDRLIGTVRMALQTGIQPKRYLMGTLAALYRLDDLVLDNPDRIAGILNTIWGDDQEIKGEEKETIIGFLLNAAMPLKKWVNDGYRNLNALI